MNGLQSGDFKSDDWSLLSSLVTSDEWSTDVATTVAGREDYFKTVRYVVLE